MIFRAALLVILVGSPLVLGDTCAQYKPVNCTVIPAIDSTGKVEPAFESYKETCPGSQCAIVAPNSTSYEWVDPESGSKKTVSEWFCGAEILNYTTRVEMNTDLPPGKKEDDYARCVHQSLINRLDLYNCRDFQHWTCDDCKAAYKLWACATVFQKCESTDPNGVMLRPCRPICNDVVRKCPVELNFKCPNDEDNRDYWDYPGHDGKQCNGLNLTVEFLSGAETWASLGLLMLVLPAVLLL